MLKNEITKNLISVLGGETGTTQKGYILTCPQRLGSRSGVKENYISLPVPGSMEHQLFQMNCSDSAG